MMKDPEFILSEYVDLMKRYIDLGAKYQASEERVHKLTEALEQIADPRLRDHTEPDAYTTLGCVMNIASEALKEDAGKRVRNDT